MDEIYQPVVPEPASSSFLTGKFLALAGGLWVAVIIAGFSLLQREEFTPVPAVRAPTDFPSHSAIVLAAGRPTLLVFLHPYCPCSQASLHELGGILDGTRDKLAVTIVFTIPDGLPPGWKQGTLWKQASSMPGVRVVCDQGGGEAQRFGVRGSGHTLLYDPAGRLLFSGGITGSRGHVGDNPGESAVTSLVLNGHAPVSRTPVFGCSLL